MTERERDGRDAEADHDHVPGDPGEGRGGARAPQTDRPHFPAEYVALVNHYAQMPADLVLETLDTFTRKVKPDLDELVGRTSR